MVILITKSHNGLIIHSVKFPAIVLKRYLAIFLLITMSFGIDLKKKEKQYCPDSGNYREFKYQSDKQFDDNLAFPMKKRVYRR